MGKWERIKLSEVLKEKTERNKNNETDLVLSVTNSQGFVKQSDFFEGTVHSENISNYKLVRKNEFAYNPSRINVGSIDILKDYDIGALSPMYVIFSVDETRLLPDYFKYYFQTHKFNENVKNNTQGSVRNSLSFKALSEFEYLLPPLEEQKRIVKILDQVNKVIEKYHNLINEKEQFIKSQFVEMFGRYKNEKKYKLKELSKFVTVGIANSATQDYTTDGIVMLRNQNIKENYLDDNDLIYINKDFSEKYKNKKLMKNDILVTRTGYPGIACIVPKKYENCQTFTTLIIRLKDDNDINANYVCHYINSIYGKRYVKDNQVGVAQQNFGATALGEMPIFIPSLYEQNVFIQIVQLIDKQKFELEKQKQNYIDLKKGLMQQLLTGKLKV